jgi:hypothetical protein
MRSIRVTSFLLAFACTLALVGCQHTASKTTQSNQGAGSQAQSASAQPADANAHAQPANAPPQSTSNSGQSAAGCGSAPSAPPVGRKQAAAPAPRAQDAQATQPDQPTQPSENVQTGTGAADNSAENLPPQVTIPEGTPVEIRLTQSLGSARSMSGQRFAATLDAPIVVDNAVVVPRGANVTGRVLYAKRSGRLRGPAKLTVTLASLEVGGKDYRIVTADKSWSGKSHKKRNLAWIGGGAGAGSLVGVAAGGGIGAAIGAGVGAGGGTVTAFVTGKKNIVLPSETRLYFVLRRPVTVG